MDIVAAIEQRQVWRLFTSLFLQDGGWVGTVFNLATLAVTLWLVCRVFPPPMLVVVFVGGGFFSNLMTMAWLQENGASSSMATMWLLAAATLIAWRRGGRQLRPGIALAVVAAVGMLLLVLRDQHGFAAVGGLAAGALMSGPPRGRGRRRRN